MSVQDYEDFAQWIVSNQDKQGTPEFETVAKAFQELDAQYMGGAQEEPIELEPNFSLRELAGRGLERGSRRLGSTFTDIIPALAGSAVGADEYAQRQMEEAAAKEEQLMRELPPQYESFRDVDGLRSGIGFIAETMGEQLPNLGAVVAGSLAGGLGAGVLGGAARVGAGQLAGAGLGSYALNAPEVFQNVYEQTGQLEPAVGLLFGAGAASLDAILPLAISKNLSGPMKAGVVNELLKRSGMDNRLLRGATAGLIQGTAVEGMTEGAQEAISIAAERFVDQNEDVFGSEEWNRILEASVRGAVAGGGFSSVGGGVGGAREGMQRQQRLDQINESRRLRTEMANRNYAFPAMEELGGIEPTDAMSPDIEMDFEEGMQQQRQAEVEAETEIAAEAQATEEFNQDWQKVQQAGIPSEVEQTAAELQAKAQAEESARIVQQTAEGMQGLTQEEALQPTDAVIPTKDTPLRLWGRKFGIGSLPQLRENVAGKNKTDPTQAQQIRDFLTTRLEYLDARRDAGQVTEENYNRHTAAIREELAQPEYSDEVLGQPVEEATSEADTQEQVDDVPLQEGEQATAPEGEQVVDQQEVVDEQEQADEGQAPTAEQVQAEVAKAGVIPPGATPEVLREMESRGQLVSTPAAPVEQATRQYEQVEEEVAPEQAAANNIISQGEPVAFYSTSRNMVEDAGTAKTIQVHQKGKRFVVTTRRPASKFETEATGKKNIDDTSYVLNEEEKNERVADLLYGKDEVARANKTTNYIELDPSRLALERRGVEGTDEYSPTVAEFAARGRVAPLANRLMESQPPDMQRILRKIGTMNLATTIRIGETDDGAVSHYDPVTNEIVLSEQGLTEHAFLHEYAHAALAQALNDPELKVTRDFAQFFEQIKDQMGDAYGGTNLQEFAAELVSNPQFQALLKNTKAPRSDSMWTNIMRAIAHFFGFRPNNYEKGIKHVENILDIAGDVDPTLEDILFLGTGTASADAAKDAFFVGKELAGEAKEKALNTFSNIVDTDFARTAANLLRLENMEQLYGKYLPAIKDLISAITLRKGEQEQGMRRAANRHKGWQKDIRNDPKGYEAMTELASDARRAKFDFFGIDQNFEITNANRARYEGMKRRYEALPEAFQKMYRGMREDYAAMYKQFQQNVIDLAETSDQAKYLKERFQQNSPVGGYVPFLRYGRYFVSFKDSTTGAQETHAFQSRREKEKFLLDNGNRISPDSKKEFYKLEDAEFDPTGLPPSSFVAQIMSALPEKISQETKNEIWQMQLALYPESSIMKRMMSAKETLGESKDMLRAYSNTMLQWSRKLAQMKYLPQIESALRNIDEQATAYTQRPQEKGAPKGGTIEAIAQNIQDRGKFIKNPYYGKWTSFFSAASFNMFLLGNISSAIINLTALPLLAYPILASRYGFGEAGRMLMQAMKQVNLKDVWASPEQWQGKYKFLYETLDNNAQLEHTLARELLEGGESPTSDYYASRRAKLMEALAKPFTAGEKYSRMVTAIAAYEMALKGNKNTSPMSEQEAADYALDVVKQVHTSAMAESAPRWMQNPLGRTFFTFKTFIWNSAFITANAFHEGVWKPAMRKGGEDAIVAREAQKQLIGIFGMSAAIGGINGLPFYGAAATLANMINALIGDDDEPFNFRDKTRAFTGEFLYKGPVNAMLNLEVSNRAGIANGLLFREDPYSVENYGYVATAFMQAFGPLGNYALEASNATRYLQEGDYGRFAESVMPSVLRNPLKAWRYTVEGARTRTGQPIDTDINAYNLAMQVLGFSPADTASIYERRSFAMNYQAKVLRRRSNLLRKAYMGYSTGDMDLYREAVGEINQFRRRYPELIKGDTLQRSIRARREIERKMILGLRINEAIKPEVIETYFDEDF